MLYFTFYGFKNFPKYLVKTHLCGCMWLWLIDFSLLYNTMLQIYHNWLWAPPPPFWGKVFFSFLFFLSKQTSLPLLKGSRFRSSWWCLLTWLFHISANTGVASLAFGIQVAAIPDYRAPQSFSPSSFPGPCSLCCGKGWRPSLLPRTYLQG